VPIRLLLAEDHTLMRAGIRALLGGLPDVEVVGEASTGPEALTLAESLRPDLVLLDISMPELNGLEVASRLMKTEPRRRIIFLSMHTDAVYVRRALQSGASGYLVKGADVPELSLAIRAVMRGESYLSPAVSKDVIWELRRSDTREVTPLEMLTPRQREILQLVTEGHSTKDIAKRLDLSVKTVEAHRSELMERLDIHDLPGLVRFAIRHGLTSPDA
jgi:DNA-binding NarL/FixJ family response regulator